MKKLTFLLCSLVPLLLSAYDTSTESQRPSIIDPKEIINVQLKSLDHLHACTERTLQQITELKTQVLLYQEAQEKYLDDTENRRLLRNMLQTADSLLNAIINGHMQHFFDPEFIAELNLLNRLSQNASLPKAANTSQ